MLTVENVSYEVNQRKLVSDVTFSTASGELLAIIGANGAGKSTLLRMLSAERKPTEGHISLYGKKLKDYSPKELALKRAVLNQHNTVNMDFHCQEIVMMGRYPHFKNRPTEQDRRVIAETMKICGVLHLAGRSFLTLSGGEQQRVQFARVLAQIWDQSGALILMDEPVASMDIQYQQQTLAIAKALCKKGFMLVVILHEINLAALYADRILMLKNGQKWKDGAPLEVLNAEHIYSVFNVEAEVQMNRNTLQANVFSKELKLDAAHFNSFL
ncbi:hemin ABC transporter ATP-binding protein [Pelobium manganitolerans]|uniref:Hemin ABC transporter ATP-binding protein n=1 Tax=Pelobium manganitolerans TaxID=1842495 RepID=A0A419SBM9_9SPHI|nr:heme ABC transporter ATP-binding protein [Pelobium manganitolerans]RKD20232.1 hemin ABC transporter ATP-binding protein [Pelobium manganitolerans]